MFSSRSRLYVKMSASCSLIKIFRTSLGLSIFNLADISSSVASPLSIIIESTFAASGPLKSLAYSSSSLRLSGVMYVFHHLELPFYLFSAVLSLVLLTYILSADIFLRRIYIKTRPVLLLRYEVDFL